MLLTPYSYPPSLSRSRRPSSQRIYILDSYSDTDIVMGLIFDIDFCDHASTDRIAAHSARRLIEHIHAQLRPLCVLLALRGCALLFTDPSLSLSVRLRVFVLFRSIGSFFSPARGVCSRCRGPRLFLTCIMRTLRPGPAVWSMTVARLVDRSSDHVQGCGYGHS